MPNIAKPAVDSRGAVGGSAEQLLRTVRVGLTELIAFTLIVNLLLFVQPIYMLQIYDRVLVSGSLETLLYISLMAAVALILFGLVDAIRGMMAVRIAARMDVEVGAAALMAAINGPKAGFGDVQPLRDLAAVRGFVSGRTILAFLDLPFAPLFIGMLFFIHAHLFWMTVAGAVVLTLIALWNQAATSRSAGRAGEYGMNAMLSAQAFSRSAESINAMGMAGHVVHAWGRDNATSLRAQDRTGMINAIFAGVSRVIRLGLQIAILGYGGYLVLQGQMTGGMIFASSLISGRGLQPIDQVIGSWKGFVEFRRAWTRLTRALANDAGRATPTALPAPVGRLTIDEVVVFAANPASGIAAEPLLKRISADILPGDIVAVIGPSGAGKSTLARTLVGALQPRSGAVRVDGADIRTWDRVRLGTYVGYLAQEVDLLPGSVAENISRYAPDPPAEAIVTAAMKAQVHDLILALPQGYDTVLGPGGQQLSGGQRQRIGLARAFYGAPRILILDEPNANLDTDGDLALERALVEARQDGVTVLIVTQRRPIIDKANKIMILRDGLIEDFGTNAEVFARHAEKAKAGQQARRTSEGVRSADGRPGGQTHLSPVATTKAAGE